jgi:hypothetical protein
MAWIIRLIFNDAVTISQCGYWKALEAGSELVSANSTGFAAGLWVGKPAGIALRFFIVVAVEI